MFSAILTHLWQSTIFAAVAALLALTLRNNCARARHRVWLAASLKFLVPFSVLVSAGSHFQWSRPAAFPQVSIAVEQISQAFQPPLQVVSVPAATQTQPFLFILWFCGFAGVAIFWFVRWNRVRKLLRVTSPMDLGLPVRTMTSPSLMEPGVFGVFRPVLLLPEGIELRLKSEQLHAIVAHELCHARRRDNLTSAIHMGVEALFWFHPLVWWIGARLVDERERACDEEVLAQGSEPQAYAEGILNVCRMYLESPLTCVSGVTGSDLRKRIEAIMTSHIVQKIGLSRKLLLAAAGIIAMAGPLVIGILNTPPGRAQSNETPRLQFEAASIKLNVSGVQGADFYFAPGGHLHARNNPLTNLIDHAFGVAYYQLAGGPDWISSDRYDVEAKAQGDSTDQQMNRMIQSLLEDRFGMRAHRETREMPVFDLTLAKGGPKLQRFQDGSCSNWDLTDPPPPPPGQKRAIHCGNNIVLKGRWVATKIDMGGVAGALTAILRRRVIDKTGITGFFDVNLQFVDDALADDGTGQSIFTAVQDQLGLKLESTKGPVDVLVIDHIERPSEN